ncbi:DinB family protein [Paenibacillus fonticola]|uniref:DinB family protein n=1 Tax=Paenibacillus fonticola TaxID=379896 RepID=UPI000366DE47|nr:DinB family protein [Paenibacillus fonticola]
MSDTIINTARIVRQVVLQQVQAIPEELFDIHPEGFNNTIRWNIGHMIFWMDKYSTLSFGFPSSIPAQYEELFNSGTKPLDWTTAPPSKDELTQLLMKQLSSFSELKPELLDKSLVSLFEIGPFQFNIAGELFNFALIHEAIHLGTISSQLKTLSR